MNRILLFLIVFLMVLDSYAFDFSDKISLSEKQTQNFSFQLIDEEDYSVLKKRKPKYAGKKRKTEWSGFISPIISYANAGEKYQLLTELHAVLSVNDIWLFGGYGASNFILPNLNVEGEEYPLEFWHAGGFLGMYGYRFGGAFRHSIFIRGGYGLINIEDPEELPIVDNFVAISPGFEIDMSIVHLIHVGFGVTYQKMYMIGNSGYSEKDFSGFSMFVTVKFGKIAR